MPKYYLIIIAVGIAITIYLSGFMRGHNKCTQQIAIQISETTKQQTIKQEKINAKIYRTAVGDIRNILRQKYTIAE